MPSLILPGHVAGHGKQAARPASPPAYDPRASASSLASSSSNGSAVSAKALAKRRFSNTRSSGEFQRTRSPALHPTDKQPTVDFCIESPPLVMYGPPKDSTGALLSGLLNLNVFAFNGEDFESCHLTLNANVSTRRPVEAYCPDCSSRTSALKEWDFLNHPSTDLQGHFRTGKHTYPFSFLLPGHLPSTSDSPLGTITYTLDALAVTQSGHKITASHELKISRAIMPSSPAGNLRTSVRVFPPTTLSATCQLPPVVHIGGVFPLDVRLEGVVLSDRSHRWRLRKLTWHINENAKIISPACPKHEAKVGGANKGVLHEDSRIIASGEMKNGWKCDFDADAGGRFEMEVPKVGIPANVGTVKTDPHGHSSCDVESSAGLTITHALVLEMVVAEENCPNARTRIVTPTGSARVLRMQFAVPVHERPGMGISWDEEQPPIYEDVPPSPPTYGVTGEVEMLEEEFGEFGL